MPLLNLQYDLGATPGDPNTPATTAIASALATMATTPDTTLYVPEGTFYVGEKSGGGQHTCTGAINPCITGPGRIDWLGPDSGILWDGWTGTLRNSLAETSIYPLPWVTGEVASVSGDGSSFTVTLDSAWPTNLTLQIEWITFFDSSDHPSNWQLNWGSSWFDTPSLSGDRLTLTVNITTGISGHGAGIEPTVGERIVVLAHKDGTSGFDYHRGEASLIESNTAYAACRPAHTWRQCTGDMEVYNFKSIPLPGEIQSVGGTPLNFSSNRGRMLIDGYRCEYAGDDPLNFWTAYMKVANVSGSQFDAVFDPQSCRFEVGDELEGYRLSSPYTSGELVPLGTTFVASIVSQPSFWNATKTLTFTGGTWTPSNGDKFVNLSAQLRSWRARNLDFANIRSRGTIIKQGNGVMERFSFRYMMGSGIVMRSTINQGVADGASEGHRVSNVTIQDGELFQTNYGVNSNENGAITCYVGNAPLANAQSAGFHSNLKFRALRIRGSVNNGIALRSVDDVEIASSVDIQDCASNDILTTASATNVTQPSDGMLAWLNSPPNADGYLEPIPHIKE